MTYDPDDLIDGVIHVNDSYELDLTPDDLRFVGIEWMAPRDVIDDSAHLGGKAYPAGWLLEYPREEARSGRRSFVLPTAATLTTSSSYTRRVL